MFQRETFFLSLSLPTTLFPFRSLQFFHSFLLLPGTPYSYDFCSLFHPLTSVFFHFSVLYSFISRWFVTDNNLFSRSLRDFPRACLQEKIRRDFFVPIAFTSRLPGEFLQSLRDSSFTFYVCARARIHRRYEFVFTQQRYSRPQTHKSTMSGNKILL